MSSSTSISVRIPHITLEDNVRRWITLLRAEKPLAAARWVHTQIGHRMLRGAMGTVPVGKLSRLSLGVTAFMMHARHAGATLRRFLAVTSFGTRSRSAYTYNSGYYVLRIYAGGVGQSTPEALGGLLVLHFKEEDAAPSLRLLQLGTNAFTGGHFVRMFYLGAADDAIRELSMQSAFDEAAFGHPRGITSHQHIDVPDRTTGAALGSMLLLALGLPADAIDKQRTFTAFKLHVRAGIALANFFTAALYGSVTEVLPPDVVLFSVALIAFARFLAEVGLDSEAGHRAMQELRTRGDGNLIVHVLLLLTAIYGYGVSTEERAILPSLARSRAQPNPRSFLRFHATLCTLRSGVRPSNGEPADDDDADEQRAKRARAFSEVTPDVQFDLVDEIIIDRIRGIIGPHAMRGLMLANRKLARKSRIFTDPAMMRTNFAELFPLFSSIFATQIGTWRVGWVLDDDEYSTVARLTGQLRGEVQYHDARVTLALERMTQRTDESVDQFSERRNTFIAKAYSLQLKRRSLLVRIDPLLRTESMDATRSAELVRRWQLFTGLVERALTNPALRRLLPRDIGGMGEGTAAPVVDAPKLVDGDILVRRLLAAQTHHAEGSRQPAHFAEVDDVSYEGEFPRAGTVRMVLRGLYYVTEWRGDQHRIEYQLRDEWSTQPPPPPPPPPVDQSLPRLLNNPPSATSELRFDVALSDVAAVAASDIAEDFAQSLMRKMHTAPRYTPMLQVWNEEKKTVEVRQLVNIVTKDVTLMGGLRVAGGGLWIVTGDASELGAWRYAAKRRQFVYAAADRAAFLGMMQHAGDVLDALPATDKMMRSYAEDIEFEMDSHETRQDYLPEQQPMIDRWETYGRSLPVSSVAIYEEMGEITVEQRREVHFTGVRIDLAKGIYTRIWTRATRRYHRAMAVNGAVMRDSILPVLQAAAAALFDSTSSEQKNASELELAWLRYMYVIAGVRQLVIGSGIGKPDPNDSSTTQTNYAPMTGMMSFFTWENRAETNLAALVRAVRSAPLRRLMRPADALQREALRKDAVSILSELILQLTESAKALITLVASLDAIADIAAAFDAPQPDDATVARFRATDAPEFTKAAESISARAADLDVLLVQLKRGAGMGLQRADTLIRIRDALMRTLITNLEDRSGASTIVAAVGDVITALISLARRAQHAHGPRGAEFERQLLSVVDTLPSVDLHGVTMAVNTVIVGLNAVRTHSYAIMVRTLAEEVARGDATAKKLAVDLALETVAEMIWSLEPRLLELRLKLVQGDRNYQLLLLDAEVLQTKFDAGFSWFTGVTAANPNRSAVVERDYHSLVLAYDIVADVYHRKVRDNLKRILRLEGRTQPLSLRVLELVKEERLLMSSSTTTASTQ